MAEANLDPFFLNDIYPEPASLFSFKNRSVLEIVNHADIVLDTNVLLLLLSTGSRSISEVEKIYQKLINEKRLFIPAQVAREFVKNRPDKIKEIYHQINLKKQHNIRISKIPLFGSIEEYQLIEEKEKELLLSLGEYSKQISKILELIKKWGNNDPVSEMYRKIGLDNCVIKSTINKNKSIEEKNKRYLHKIPPGYKDSTKGDGGIGDFLIWTEILSLGSENKNDLIFVTGEEKTDWWVKSSGSELYVRHELVDEYQRSSQGKSFQLISLSDLLELFNAELEAVDQTKAAQQEEVEKSADLADSAPPTTSYQQPNFPSFARSAEAAVKRWVRENLGSYISSFNTSDPKLDFIASSQNCHEIGYEVKAIRHIEYIDRRIGEVFNIGKNFVSSRPPHNAAFRAVFVAESLEDAIKGSDISKSINTDPHLGFIIGHLNDELEFCEIFRSYPSDFDEAMLLF